MAQLGNSNFHLQNRGKRRFTGLHHPRAHRILPSCRGSFAHRLRKHCLRDRRIFAPRLSLEQIPQPVNCVLRQLDNSFMRYVSLMETDAVVLATATRPFLRALFTLENIRHQLLGTGELDRPDQINVDTNGFDG